VDGAAAQQGYNIDGDLPSWEESLRLGKFQRWDKDNSGTLSADEAYKGIEAAGTYNVSKATARDALIRRMVALLDKNADGIITPEEIGGSVSCEEDLLSYAQERIAGSCRDATRGRAAVFCRSQYYGYVSPQAYASCPAAKTLVLDDLRRFSAQAIADHLAERPAIEPPYNSSYDASRRWGEDFEQNLWLLDEEPAVQQVLADLRAERAAAFPTAEEALKRYLRQAGRRGLPQLLLEEERNGELGERLAEAVQDGEVWIAAGNDPILLPSDFEVTERKSKTAEDPRVVSIPDPGFSEILGHLKAGRLLNIPDDLGTRIAVENLGNRLATACDQPGPAGIDLYTVRVKRGVIGFPLSAAVAADHILLGGSASNLTYDAIIEDIVEDIVATNGCNSPRVRNVADNIARLVAMRAAKEPDPTGDHGNLDLYDSCMRDPEIDAVDCHCAVPLVLMSRDIGVIRAFIANFWAAYSGRRDQELYDFGVHRCIAGKKFGPFGLKR
jgi:hypothetical protein